MTGTIGNDHRLSGPDGGNFSVILPSKYPPWIRASGYWQQVTEIDGTLANESLGFAVAVSGGTLVVSDRPYDMHYAGENAGVSGSQETGTTRSTTFLSVMESAGMAR